MDIYTTVTVISLNESTLYPRLKYKLLTVMKRGGHSVTFDEHRSSAAVVAVQVLVDTQFLPDYQQGFTGFCLLFLFFIFTKIDTHITPSILFYCLSEHQATARPFGFPQLTSQLSFSVFQLSGVVANDSNVLFRATDVPRGVIPPYYQSKHQSL